jgi:hypothetical protein
MANAISFRFTYKRIAWNFKNASRNKQVFFSHLWGHKKKKDTANFLPIVHAREYMKEHNLKQLDELYISWKNKTRPDTKWKMTGDMTGRLDWLVETFSGLDSITEFGAYQGCSTAAWLKCLPKKLTTVDIGRALDENLYVELAKGIGVDFGKTAFLAARIGLENLIALGFRNELALVAQRFLHGFEKAGCVDELHLAPAFLFFLVGNDPDIRGDAGIEEELVGKRDNAFQPVVFDDPFADFRFTAAGIAREER